MDYVVSMICHASATSLSVVSTHCYTYISQFSVNPHHRQKRKSRRRCHRNSVPNRFSSRFLTSPTNGPRSLSQTKMGNTLGVPVKIAHKGTHGETGGISDGGGITTLGLFHTFRKPCVAGCQNGVLCRFWALVGGTPEGHREPAVQRCAYARRCSAGVAAPLGCVIFFASAEIAVCTSCAQGFQRVRDMGGITTLSALYVLLKRRTAACQNGSFAVF